MQQKNNRLIIILLLSILVLAAGCREHRAVRFLWPDLDDPYQEVAREWSRSGKLYSGIETDAIVHATFKSRQWRQAYIEKRAEVYGLTEKEQAGLYSIAVDSMDRETEVFLSIFSPKPEQARIRFSDPLWSIFIQTEDEKIYPLEIRAVRKPLAKLQTFYPYAGQWSHNYILRFPEPTRDSLVMIMTGPLGRLEFDW